MAVGTTITDILNQWADFGVFAYVLPFLIIFAVVFGILSKSRVLGDNKGVQSVIALAVGLISLQFDTVTNFFAIIFPFAGVGLSVLLVALILMGLLFSGDEKIAGRVFFGIGALIFLIVVGTTFYEYSFFGGYRFGNIGAHLIWIIPVVALIMWVIFGKKPEGG